MPCVLLVGVSVSYTGPSLVQNSYTGATNSF